MKQQQKKYPPLIECPSPSDGPFAMILYRLDQLEQKVDKILPKIYQTTGIIGFLKIAGAFIVGAVAVAAFFMNHINFH